MQPNHTSQVTHVIEYYKSIESRLGYRYVLRGVRHYGIHPDPSKPLSIAEAQQYENDLVAKHLGVKPGSKLLELGCGEGSSACNIARKYTCTIDGIDLLEESINRGNQFAQENAVTASFHVGDYSRLADPNATFDGVYAIETLVHAPDIKSVLAEVYRVLKPGGRFVFCEYSIQDKSKLSTRSSELLDIFIRGGAMHALPELRHGAVQGLLEQAGFKDITIENMLQNALPTAKYFAQRARLPYKILRTLHLEHRFINTTTAVESYRLAISEPDAIHYNLVSARKPM